MPVPKAEGYDVYTADVGRASLPSAATARLSPPALVRENPNPNTHLEEDSDPLSSPPPALADAGAAGGGPRRVGGHPANLGLDTRDTNKRGEAAGAAAAAAGAAAAAAVSANLEPPRTPPTLARLEARQQEQQRGVRARG